MKKLGLLLCLLLGLTACGQVEYKEKEKVFSNIFSIFFFVVSNEINTEDGISGEILRVRR